MIGSCLTPEFSSLTTLALTPVQHFRDTRFGKSVCLFLVVLFAATSCAKDEVASPAFPAAKEYSSEQLFRGIFFAQGEVATKISTLQPQVQVLAKQEAGNAELKKTHA